METARRSIWIYGLLLAAWVLILGWQIGEHLRVQRAARAELIYRAKDISTTVGIVLRSQRHFGGVVTKERLESALAALVKPGDLNAIALLNAIGDVVASAGATNDLVFKGAVRPAELWEAQTVTLMNPVDLGANVTRDMEGTNPPIVLSRQNFPRPTSTNAPPPPPPPEFASDAGRKMDETSNAPPSVSGRGRHDGDGRPRFGRPRWMSEEEFKDLIQKRGVHSFVIVMSTHSLRIASQKDLWLRLIIGVLATIAVAGLALAWRNMTTSSELQIRLVRTSELNAHLKEMNLAAAGLAHETRNPLNIIRGLAQMLSKQPDASPEIRQKTREIIDETDHVTAQLNEFINYSKPREVRRTTLALGPLVNEVIRTLTHDIEEKNVRLQTVEKQITIEADEQLLRQALFNLLLNAIQAVEKGGEIQIVAEKLNPSEAFLDIRDNGPGVPADRRKEVFKPYFTTQQNGTGLGLAVVQQIVLAHGWEIECLANEPHGAIFRITHLKLAA